MNGHVEMMIAFATAKWLPNNLITLRNNVDGWQTDIFGRYRDGKWVFFLDKRHYPKPIELAFWLNSQIRMNGEVIRHDMTSRMEVNDTSVTFPETLGSQKRFEHGYENLITYTNALTQRLIPANRREDKIYDVVVVGSGMGGGILADALSDSGLEVLVLEAGSFQFPTNVYNLPGKYKFRFSRSSAVKHHIIDNTLKPKTRFDGDVNMNFGGQSIFWSGIIPRMRWELEAWPLEIREFLTTGGGYNAAEQLLHKQKTLGPFQNRLVADIRAQLGQEFLVEDLPRSREQQFITKRNNREIVGNVLRHSSGLFSSADLLLDSLSVPGKVGRDNLTINLNHLVTAIETNGRRATTVVCQDMIAHKTRRYRGKVIVLAAGAIASAAIALRSGLSDRSQKIGRGLTDHSYYIVRVPKKDLSRSSYPISITDHAKVLISHKQATVDFFPWNTQLLVNSEYWHRSFADEDIWNELISKKEPLSNVQIRFSCGSKLDDDNFVSLDSSSFKPRLYVKPNNSECFVDDVRRTSLQILECFNILPSSKDLFLRYKNKQGARHAGGSLRIGTETEGVVDSDLRFHQYDNLFACDLSVFPFIAAANPSLTLAALALRLSKKIGSMFP